MRFGRGLGLATALLAMASSGGRAQDSIPEGDWRTINRDAAATRFSPLDDINRANVAELEREQDSLLDRISAELSAR